jgi:hypothetical protein
MSTLNAITSGAGGVALSGDTSGNLTLQTNNGTTAVTVDTSQNVGVGTTSPLKKLDVYLGTTGTVGQYLRNTTINLLSQIDGTTSAQFGTETSHPLLFLTGNNERMRIDSSGCVIINNTATVNGAKLFTLGNGVGMAVGYGTGSSQYRHMYMNSGDGTLYFWNPTNYAYLSAAGAWTSASDARLKKNIADIKYGLADVLKAQPRSYEMNSVEGEYVGFIAQELQQVIPEVVTGDPEKQLGVDYGSLVAVAFKAIQELNAKVDAQAAEIAALKGA